MRHRRLSMADHEQHAANRPVLSWWELWPVLGWGLFTVYLFATGRMFYLLRPIYGYLALAAGVVLLAAFLYGWILRLLAKDAEDAGEPACTEGYDACQRRTDSRTHGLGLYIRSLVFIMPLAVGFTLPERGLTSLAAIQWGAGDIAQAAQLAAEQEQQKAEWERGYESVSVIGVALRLRETQAQKVAAMGLVVHRMELPADQFLLVRFRMICCAADAQPVAVPVRWAQAASLKENAWVKVFGQTDHGVRALIADEVEPTKEPGNPYL
jgi:uncharacterized repeat protein (TIGR03943 family)